MPIQIPKVPLYTPKQTEEKKKKRKEKQKGSLGYFDFPKEDLESDNKRGLESDKERDRAYSELISRFEHDKEGGGGAEADIKENKDKEKEKEKEKRKKKATYYIDLYMRMYFQGVLFLFGEINEKKAKFVRSMIFTTNIRRLTKRRGRKKDVFLFINSMGGGLMPGIELYNIITMGPVDINTVCVGKAFSIACFLLAAGKKKKRRAGANAMIMLHDASIPSFKNDCDELYDDMGLLTRMNGIVERLLAKRMGKDLDILVKDLKSEKFMSAEEAQSHGIIDSIVDEKNYKDIMKRLIRRDGKSRRIKDSAYFNSVVAEKNDKDRLL